jgi:sulfite exporter TauE/SafE
MTNLLVPFLTGLTTGGLSCFALQGGLFSSLLVSAKNSRAQKLYAIISFLGSKVLMYSLLGFALGLAGNFFTPSPKLSGFLNLLIAGFMIGVALEALKVHPIFRYFLLQPPKFVRKLVRQNSKKENVFNGAVLGASTILIPCGTTQAMMALAVSSQNAFSGMSTLAAFTLGTVPMFLVFGLTATRLNEKYSRWMSKAIAVVLLVLAGYTILYSFRLMGITTGSGNRSELADTVNIVTDSNTLGQVQKLNVSLTDSGYVPQKFTVKKGVPVQLTVTNREARGCIQAFVIPDLNIRRTIRQGAWSTIDFTPQKAGKISFTCSMGMYYGEINVI